ncbi:hypothetical protein K3495_g1975 [Podosphaera aphanis]|nr:hypothetical protein K3495_g1975 [Podosphaera aphanis]
MRQPKIYLMSANRSSRSIRGPQSALTDFLASHNISAAQILADADARRATALAAHLAEQSTAPATGESPQNRRNESSEQIKKRKRDEEKAIAKIKASKASKASKLRQMFKSSFDQLSDEELSSFEEQLSAVGQMANCESCEKRFSVTVYSRAGSNKSKQSLLCLKCSRELDKEESEKKRRKKRLVGAARRKNASNILDGIYPGAKDLVTLCVETLANNVHEAESFGDLPLDLIKRLSAVLSKRRLITSPILDLFLEQKHESLTITDGAKLNSDDYIRIFQIVPRIKHLKLRNAVQFKNRVVDHLLGTTVNLETFDIHGANLIDEETWSRFLREKGSHLRSLKVHFTDSYFGDEAVETLITHCPQLQRLKISHNAKLSDEGLEKVFQLSKLEYFSIELYRPTSTSPLTPTPLVKILDSIGAELRTFSVEAAPKVDDSMLIALHTNCKKLTKLRITGSETVTDEGFALLFTNWANSPITYLDLSGCRHVDAAEPRKNPNGIGLASSGFEALMAHSGHKLRYLDVSSCRHISLESFESVFGTEKVYSEMEHIDISFCQAVNDFVVGSIFRCCPNLKILTVFGCFGVKSVKVPKGKILTGTPNALGLQIEGTED